MRIFSALALFSLAGVEQVAAQRQPDVSVGRRGILPRAAISTIYRFENSDGSFTYYDNCSCPSNGGGAASSTGNANPGNAGTASSNAGQGTVSPTAGQAGSVAGEGTPSQQGSAAVAATPAQFVPGSLPALTLLGVTAPGNLVSIQGSISVQGLPNQPQTIIVYVGLFIDRTVKVSGQATSTITSTTTATVTTTVSTPTSGTNTGGAGVLPIPQTSTTASSASGGAGVLPVISSSSRGFFLNSTSSSTSSGGSASALPLQTSATSSESGTTALPNQSSSTASSSSGLSSTSSCPLSTSVSTSTVTLTALPITTTGNVATLNGTSTLPTATDVFTIQVTTTTTVTVSLGPLTTSTVLLDPTNTVDITQSSVSETSTVGPFSTTTTTTNTDTTTTTLASTGIIATVTQNVNFCTYQDASCPVVGTSIAFFGYVDHTASITALVSATVSAGFVCASAAFTDIAGVPQNPAPNQRKTCYLGNDPATARMRKRQAVATIASCAVSNSVSIVTEFVTPTVTIIPLTTLLSTTLPRISGSTTSSTGTTTTETSYSSSTSLVQLTATRTNTVTVTTTISDPTAIATSVSTSVSTTVSSFVLLTSTITSLTEAPTCTGLFNLNANAGAGGQGTVVNLKGLVTFQAGAPSSGGAVQLNGNVLSFAQARFVPRGQLQSFALDLTQASANAGCGNVIATTSGTGLLSCSVSMANGDTITCTAPAPYNTGIFSSTFSVDPTTGNLRIGCTPAGVAATLRQECIATQADGTTCTLPGQCTSNYCNSAGICAVSPPPCSINADCSQGSYCSYESVCATQRKVLVLAAEEEYYIPDVTKKLNATKRFGTVDFINARFTTPTLAQLRAYDAVLTWGIYGYQDQVAMGNVLADYIDASHRVVNAVFSCKEAPYQYGLQGRFITGGYATFPSGTDAQRPQLTLLPVLVNDPLLNAVKSFDGGPYSVRCPGTSISKNATLVATWSNGDRLVVEKPGVKGVGSVVGLNFYPLSTDSFSLGWNATTDGTLLLANALTNYPQ